MFYLSPIESQHVFIVCLRPGISATTPTNKNAQEYKTFKVSSATRSVSLKALTQSSGTDFIRRSRASMSVKPCREKSKYYVNV